MGWNQNVSTLVFKISLSEIMLWVVTLTNKTKQKQQTNIFLEAQGDQTLVRLSIKFNFIWFHNFLYGFTNITQSNVNSRFLEEKNNNFFWR